MKRLFFIYYLLFHLNSFGQNQFTIVNGVEVSYQSPIVSVSNYQDIIIEKDKSEMVDEALKNYSNLYDYEVIQVNDEKREYRVRYQLASSGSITGYERWIFDNSTSKITITNESLNSSRFKYMAKRNIMPSFDEFYNTKKIEAINEARIKEYKRQAIENSKKYKQEKIIEYKKNIIKKWWSDFYENFSNSDWEKLIYAVHQAEDEAGQYGHFMQTLEKFYEKDLHDQAIPLVFYFGETPSFFKDTNKENLSFEGEQAGYLNAYWKGVRLISYPVFISGSFDKKTRHRQETELEVELYNTERTYSLSKKVVGSKKVAGATLVRKTITIENLPENTWEFQTKGEFVDFFLGSVDKGIRIRKGHFDKGAKYSGKKLDNPNDFIGIPFLLQNLQTKILALEQIEAVGSSPYELSNDWNNFKNDFKTFEFIDQLGYNLIDLKIFLANTSIMQDIFEILKSIGPEYRNSMLNLLREIYFQPPLAFYSDSFHPNGIFVGSLGINENEENKFRTNKLGEKKSIQFIYPKLIFHFDEKTNGGIILADDVNRRVLRYFLKDTTNKKIKVTYKYVEGSANSFYASFLKDEPNKIIARLDSGYDQYFATRKSKSTKKKPWTPNPYGGRNFQLDNVIFDSLEKFIEEILGKKYIKSSYTGIDFFFSKNKNQILFYHNNDWFLMFREIMN